MFKRQLTFYRYPVRLLCQWAPTYYELPVLTFIRTQRNSHTKELWGLLGPQDFVLCPCNNKKRYRKYWHLHAKRFEKIDNFIPSGSQKTPRVPFKVKTTSNQANSVVARMVPWNCQSLCFISRGT